MEKYLVYYSDAAVEVSENNIPSSSQILFCQTTSKSINVFLKKCWIYRVMISQKSREFRFRKATISTEQHCQLFTFFSGCISNFQSWYASWTNHSLLETDWTDFKFGMNSLILFHVTFIFGRWLSKFQWKWEKNQNNHQRGVTW